MDMKHEKKRPDKLREGLADAKEAMETAAAAKEKYEELTKLVEDSIKTNTAEIEERAEIALESLKR